MTDISQTQAGFKAKSRRNPLWIPRLLTPNPAVFVEIDYIFDFSGNIFNKTDASVGDTRF
jgi:hypothetical protein